MSRVIQSIIALESGEKPIEPFNFTENENTVNAEKLLYVVTDPFQIELNSKRNLNALYNHMEGLLRSDPELFTQWEQSTINLSELLNIIIRQLPCMLNPKSELTLAQYCKATDLIIAEKKTMDPVEHIYSLLDFAAEFMPDKLIVLCNTGLYLDETQRYEILKYICYTKLRVLMIDRQLPAQLYQNEIRWIIHNDFSDEIMSVT